MWLRGRKPVRTCWRATRRVDMKVVVDRGVCQSHGQCEIMAPGVFRLGEDAKPEDVGEFEETYREDVVAAVDACPARAIRLADDITTTPRPRR
ncbi:ferredoxin [Nocardia pseudovaccinii]|uniref:ferredoxin n=1 Tax=Nocardia pseudovaccinii TaxID=189540 RepID=UPI003D8DBE21